MKNGIMFMGLLFLAGAVLFAGCMQPQYGPGTPVPTTATATTPAPTTPAPVTDTVTVVSNPQYGQILADANGRTLYYFLRDTPGSGMTACTGACPANWPAFSAGNIQVSEPLRASNFGTITLSDGRLQTTYLGWPLYYYSGDMAAGDTKGNGVLNIWYVMAPGGVVTLAPTTTIPTTTPTPAPTTASSGSYY
jgi:predicted lipoprotein with Yx(FWY)xxD motif